MFHVVLSVDLLVADKFIREKYGNNWIDLSGVPSDELADQSDTLLGHRIDVPIYLGFLDILRMLSPYHETRLRRLFRERTVILLSSDPSSLPFSWKNGIDKATLYETTWRS